MAASLKDAPHWPRGAYLSRAGCERDAAGELRWWRKIPKVGTVEGFAVACATGGRRRNWSRLRLPQTEQRRGIGRELLSAMVEELRAAGVREVLLEVRASNQRARGFYRSLGWIETGRRPRYYADPEEDAVLMRLELE